MVTSKNMYTQTHAYVCCPGNIFPTYIQEVSL